MSRRPPKPPKRTTLATIRVHRSPLDRRRGRLVAGSLVLPCALGRSGTRHGKREGDGATPIGRFRALQAFYRRDRLRRPGTRLPLAATSPRDGWCDDPGDRNYNCPVRLPYPGRHERMQREDGLYDVVVDLAYNRGPIRKGRGSAIFLHCANPGLTPTEGCVAVDPRLVARLLALIGPRTRIEVVG
jgi:L,D-peptidoglycan transpeptidase YkuD (ErfK/YbiS/YcfS/YnhG family)